MKPPKKLKRIDEGDLVRLLPDGVCVVNVLAFENEKWKILNITCEVTDKKVILQRWDKNDDIQCVLMPDYMYILDLKRLSTLKRKLK